MGRRGTHGRAIAQFKRVRLLKEAQADHNAAVLDGTTPLQVAAKNGTNISVFVYGSLGEARPVRPVVIMALKEKAA